MMVIKCCQYCFRIIAISIVDAHCILLYVVVQVEFSQTVYETTEDSGGVEICAELSGPDIERSLMAFLTTSEGTAQGMCMESV